MLNNVNVSFSGDFGLWGAKWADNSMVAGVAQCIPDNEAASMINLSSGSLIGLECPSGTGTCSCMCGLLAYKSSGGDVCGRTTPIWMNDYRAINTMNTDIDEETQGGCTIRLCSKECSNKVFLYDGWKHTFGIQ